jgi:sterol desaturase/sphingolipid hydroxylase (fatty acid hydroxylase superfamily)
MTIDEPTDAYRIVRRRTPPRKKGMRDWVKRVLFYVPMFTFIISVVAPMLVLFMFNPEARAYYVLIIFGVFMLWMGVVTLFEWKCFPDD